MSHISRNIAGQKTCLTLGKLSFIRQVPTGAYDEKGESCGSEHGLWV